MGAGGVGVSARARVAPRRATLVCSGGACAFHAACGTLRTPVRVDFVGWCCGLALGASSHRAVHAAMFCLV